MTNARSTAQKRIKEALPPSFPVFHLSSEPFAATFDSMSDAGVACILVTDPGSGKVCGIYTDRDGVPKLLDPPIEADRDAQLHDYMHTNVVSMGLDELLVEAGKTMARLGIRHIPIVRQGHPVGLVRLEMLLRCLFEVLDDEERAAMAAISHAGIKTKKLATVAPSATVRDTVQVMLSVKDPRNKVGAVAVVRDGVLIGMVTERDLTTKVLQPTLADGVDRRNHAIIEFTSTVVHTAPETASVLDIMIVMMQNRIRHVPIVKDGDAGKEVTKIVSMRDLLPILLNLVDTPAA